MRQVRHGIATQPQPTPNTSHGLHGSLQLRTQAQDPQRPNAPRIHQKYPESRAKLIDPEPDLPDAGAEHLNHRASNGAVTFLAS